MIKNYGARELTDKELTIALKMYKRKYTLGEIGRVFKIHHLSVKRQLNNEYPSETNFEKRIKANSKITITKIDEKLYDDIKEECDKAHQHTRSTIEIFLKEGLSKIRKMGFAKYMEHIHNKETTLKE